MCSISSANPFDLYWPEAEDSDSSSSCSDTASDTERESEEASPASSELSSAVEVIDPRTACSKIVGFLAKKVRMARSLKEYRKTLTERRLEAAPAKTVYDVKIVPVSDIDNLKKVIENWKKELDDLLEDESRLSDSEYAKICASSAILEDLLHSCDIKSNPKRKRSTKPDSLRVALDSDGKVQAIAHIKRAYKPASPPFTPDYKIKLLATAPGNLRLSFQKEGAKGAATALIEDVAFDCLRNTGTRSISLITLNEAVDFYKKLGFTSISWRSGECSLSKVHLLAFLAKFGGIATPTE